MYICIHVYMYICVYVYKYICISDRIAPAGIYIYIMLTYREHLCLLTYYSQTLIAFLEIMSSVYIKTNKNHV